VGVTGEDVRDVLIAVAPVTGTSLVVRAAQNIAKALGFAIAVAEAELDAEANEADSLWGKMPFGGQSTLWQWA
jgi:hypothetical protein